MKRKLIKLFKHDVRKDYIWWKVIKAIDYIAVIPLVHTYKLAVVMYNKTNELMERYNFPPQNPLAMEYAYELHYLNKISTAMRRKHIIECSRRKRMKVGIVIESINN
jgi:hypothetical protein